MRFLFSQWHYWTFRSSGTWHCDVGSVVADILKEHSAFETLGTTHPMTQRHIPQDLNANVRYVQMTIYDTKVGLMSCPRNCFLNMYFIFYATKKFVVFTRKQKHITLHSFYLQYLNMWQSPSKQHNSQFHVLDHKEEWMVGNKLLSARHPPTTEHYKRSCWEARRKTQQMLRAPPFSCSDS